MCRTPVDGLCALTARIAEAINDVTLEMVESTLRKIEYRLNVLLATKEAHVKTC